MCFVPKAPQPYARLPEHPPDYQSEDSAVPSWMAYQVIQDRQRRRLLAGREKSSVFEQPSVGQRKLGGS